MATAETIITKALRRYGIIDITEQPTTSDFTNCIPVLNDLLRADQSDGACQYFIRRAQDVLLPPGVNGSIYTFVVGAVAGAVLNVDAVAVRAIWIKDINMTVNRETRTAPTADVVRTTYPGLITKWHQERQSDGSILITAWQPPRAACRALIEYGGRQPEITGVNSDIAMPPEGINETVLLLGRALCPGYGRSIPPTDPVMMDAERAHVKWSEWARGQQWLRFVRN